MAVVTITTANDADFIRGFIYRYLSGTPVNLTGNKLRMGIRRKAKDVTEEMLLTTENGGLVLSDAVAGKFTVILRQQQLLILPVADYEHSLIRTRPDGAQLRIWTGTLINNAGPSR